MRPTRGNLLQESRSRKALASAPVISNLAEPEMSIMPADCCTALHSSATTACASLCDQLRDSVRTLSVFVDENNKVNFYDGKVRVVDTVGKELYKYSPPEYIDYVAEHVEPWSYLKFPFLKKIP